MLIIVYIAYSFGIFAIFSTVFSCWIDGEGKIGETWDERFVFVKILWFDGIFWAESDINRSWEYFLLIIQINKIYIILVKEQHKEVHE